jgi:peptide/nickel transport system permease protein
MSPILPRSTHPSLFLSYNWLVLVMSYLWKRLSLAPLLMLTVSFLTFWGLRLIGSNQSIVQGMLGTNYTDDNAARLTKEMGLNKPFFVQYFEWLGKILRGDLGTSFYSRQSVWSYLQTGIPTTIQLVVMSIVFALLLSVPLGILAAYRSGTTVDRTIGSFSFALLSLPSFVIGILLIFLLAVRLKWFPAGQSVPLTENPWQSIKHLILPSLALALGLTATFQRALRTDMVNNLQEDYVTLAKSKGLSDRYILMRHVLRPSSFTLVTLAGVTVGGLVGNAFIIEQLFTLNGVGRKVIQALFQRDFPVVLSGTMMITFVFVVTTTIVDLLYGVLDPRIRHARAAG